MFRTVIKRINGVISFVLALVLLLAAAYAVYCLWDNKQIYAAAENVREELLLLKPKEEAAEEGPTFTELLTLNPDVRAWISMDGTKIDHPVLQGASNLDYINKDIYGNFALAGSIFLDSRNEPDFSDPYNILYGHHMAKSAMFGDLDKYLEKDFFEENVSGELLLPGKKVPLQVICCIMTRASEKRIFEPEFWKNDVTELLDFAQTDSLHVHEEVLQKLQEKNENGIPVRLMALTTCSSDYTDARTIVLVALQDDQPQESKTNSP